MRNTLPPRSRSLAISSDRTGKFSASSALGIFSLFDELKESPAHLGVREHAARHSSLRVDAFAPTSPPMSKTPLIRPPVSSKTSLCFAIVASQYNNTYVQPLIEFATAEINDLEPEAHLSLVRVPGSFEIPLAVKLVAMQKRTDVILALGVILQGETAHAELIARSVSNALMDIALEFTVPVIHEVLLLKNEEQAKARCLRKELNRGIEAARAAVAMARTARQLSSD
jgi:6,7-dimethyl-8-ribityllumazine synthase